MAYTNGIGTGTSLATPIETNPARQAGPVDVSATPQQPVNDGLRQADQVSFSAASSAVSGDDVRTDKVQQLQAAIASGTYNVSAGDVADKVMDSLLG